MDFSDGEIERERRLSSSSTWSWEMVNIEGEARYVQRKEPHDKPAHIHSATKKRPLRNTRDTLVSAATNCDTLCRQTMRYLLLCRQQHVVFWSD